LEENNQKTNFFKQAFKSVKDLDEYEDFATELPKKSFKYLLKLVLVFTVIITLFYSYKILDSLNEIYSNLKVKLPDFSYSQGVLKVDSEKPILFEEYEDTFGKVIIDTNKDNAEFYEEEINNNSLVVLILKNKLIVASNGTAGQVMYNYSEIAANYNVSEFTKQDVINYIDGINIVSIYSSIYFAMFIYLFMIYFISILVDVLILAILARIVSIISRIGLKFAPAFNIAVHSITLSVILNLIYIIVNLLTGFTIKYFGLMYSTISYIYVIVAVLMIKTDFITRQLELIKLAEEQQKVKEELQKQKEEEEKKKQEENNEKQNKEQEKKTKKKKQKEDGGEIEGEANPSVIQEKQ